jgi:hypothetical protein
MRMQRRVRAWLVIAVAMVAAAALRADAPAASAARNVLGISTEDYRKHLEALAAVTAECAKGRNKTSCDPERIGADDNVTNVSGGGSAPHGETRVVRYDWLRALFLQAQNPDRKPDEAKKPVQASDATLPAPKTPTELLQDAQKRLAEDMAQAGAPARAIPAHKSESEAMRQVLARREFHRLQQLNPGQSVYERAMSWLNRFFNGMGHLLEGAAWVGRVLVWGFLLAVAVGLVWALLQLERRWRVKLVADASGPAPTAASARDWQLWMEDARHAAESGLWREAIHFLYWASISRLESKRLWPADRARTPREYLALVAQEDPRKAGLAALTGSFERVWYGGRTASEADYRRADALAAALIAGGEAR